MPKGDGRRRTTRYTVRLTVPRRGGWRAWGAVRSDFEAALASPGDPAVLTAELASEKRRGADYVQAVIVVTASASDVAEAIAIAWEAFRSAVAGDRLGWDLAAAAAEGRPLPAADHGLSGCSVPGVDLRLAVYVTSCPLAVASRDRKVTSGRAGSRSASGPAKMLTVLCLPYTWSRIRPQKRRRPPARGAIQRQPHTARSDPDCACRPSPDPEQKANNRGQSNRPAG